MTWNPKGVRGIIYNLQYKDYNDFSLKISKIFTFDRLQVKVFADVSNLFNFKYFSNSSFWDVHDYNYYMYSLHLPKSKLSKLGYNGIPGNDQPGDYRKAGVKFQPMEYTADYTQQTPTVGVIYWDAKTEKYMEYVNDNWQEVEQKRIDKILKDKAYIDMPNQTFFTFLEPRDIFLGLTISFDFGK